MSKDNADFTEPALCCHCRYFGEYQHWSNGKPEINVVALRMGNVQCWGKCVRHCPQVVYDGEQACFAFPATHSTDRCGDFEVWSANFLDWIKEGGAK